MNKKTLSRKQELELLRKQVSELKKKAGERPKPISDDEPVLSKVELDNKTVQQLRRIVVDNKLFTGISRMKKAKLVNDIMKTDWFKSRSLARPTEPRPTIAGQLKKEREERKKQKEEERKERMAILKKKKELEEQLKEVEKQGQEIEAEKEEDIELIPKRGIPEPPSISVLPSFEKQGQEIGTEKQGQEIGTEKQGQEIGTENEDLISHHDPEKKRVDVGNTIINMYCGGSSHPEFPIPQSLVRQALQAQQLPLYQQQEIGTQLKRTAPSVPTFQGIPSEIIPEPVFHPSHKNIKERFEKQGLEIGTEKQVKKFPPVKTTKPLKKIVEPVKEEQIKDPFAEDDDDDIPETAQEKSKRLQKEELAKVAQKGQRQKAKMDAVKAKLEGIFKAKLAK